VGARKEKGINGGACHLQREKKKEGDGQRAPMILCPHPPNTAFTWLPLFPAGRKKKKKRKGKREGKTKKEGESRSVEAHVRVEVHPTFCLPFLLRKKKEKKKKKREKE